MAARCLLGAGCTRCTAHLYAPPGGPTYCYSITIQDCLPAPPLAAGSLHSLQARTRRSALTQSTANSSSGSGERRRSGGQMCTSSCTYLWAAADMHADRLPDRNAHREGLKGRKVTCMNGWGCWVQGTVPHTGSYQAFAISHSYPGWTDGWIMLQSTSGAEVDLVQPSSRV